MTICNSKFHCKKTHTHKRKLLENIFKLHWLAGNTSFFYLSLTRTQVMLNMYDIDVSYFTVIAFSTRISLLSVLLAYRGIDTYYAIITT